MGVNRHPFVKDKWDERAYFLVQDVLYEGMDDGHVSVNAGVSDLAILDTGGAGTVPVGTGKKTPGEPGHTRDTRTHTGTRITASSHVSAPLGDALA